MNLFPLCVLQSFTICSPYFSTNFAQVILYLGQGGQFCNSWLYIRKNQNFCFAQQQKKTCLLTFSCVYFLDPRFRTATALLEFFWALFMATNLVVELTVVDKTLFTQLRRTFQFYFLISASVVYHFSLGMNVMLFPASRIHYWASTADYLLHAISVMIATPLLVVWIFLHDASVSRPRSWTLVVLIVMLLFLLHSYVSGVIYGPLPGTARFWCVNGNCMTIDSLLTRPGELQLIIWITKHLYSLVRYDKQFIMISTDMTHECTGSLSSTKNSSTTGFEYIVQIAHCEAHVFDSIVQVVSRCGKCVFFDPVVKMDHCGACVFESISRCGTYVCEYIVAKMWSVN